MDLNVHVKGDTREEVIAKLAEYLADVLKRRDDAMASHVPGVTAQAGGGGGP